MKEKPVKFEDLKGWAICDVFINSDIDIILTIEPYVGACEYEKKIYALTPVTDCCCRASIESMDGDIKSLIGKKIMMAEESGNVGTDPEEQWTFYKLGTLKDSVTIRFFGSSEYYAAEVSFVEVPAYMIVLLKDNVKHDILSYFALENYIDRFDYILERSLEERSEWK